MRCNTLISGYFPVIKCSADFFTAPVSSGAKIYYTNNKEMNKDMIIRNERQSDYNEVENLVREAFPGQLTYGGVMETSRIILRPWMDRDAPVLFRWASDPDVGPRAGWAPHRSVEESLEVIRTVFRDATNTWAIELKETGEAIGAMGYGHSCECNLPARDGEPLIGYWIAKPYWNRGICTEALGLMIEHIRQVTDVKSLISGHFVDNPASGRVMEKCGFIPTGETVIDEAQYQGKDHPIRVLRLELR